MNRGEQLLRGSGVAQQVDVGWKPYRYNNEPGWDPAKLGPMPTAAQEREARAAEFARLREESGLGVYAAAAAMGLPVGSGRTYERQRRLRAGAT